MPVLTEKDIFPDELRVPEMFSAISRNASAEDIHQARLLVKKLRARLFMLQTTVPACASALRTTNVKLQLFNQSMSHRRDFDVAIKILQNLLKKDHSNDITDIINELLKYFRLKIEQENFHTIELSQKLNDIISDLTQIEHIELSINQFNNYIQNQLKDCDGVGEAALSSKKCSKLHSWRKRVKTLYYQLQILETTDKIPDDLSSCLNDLGKQLGLVHDYCFILDLVNSVEGSTALNYDATPLLQLLKNRKNKKIESICILHNNFRYLTVQFTDTNFPVL